MSAVTIFNTPITRFEDLNKVSTDDLLAYYNGITGRDTKQFSKRAKGMQQVWKLIEDEVSQDGRRKAQSPARAVTAESKPEETRRKPASKEVAPAAAPETAEKPAKEGSLKTQVGALINALASGPRTVAEIAQELKLANEKRARSLIDAARRAGHSIACVGKGTFSLTACASE